MKFFTQMVLIFISISLIFGLGGIIILEKLEQLTNPLIEIIPQKIDELTLKAQSDKQAQLIRYYDEILTQSARNYAFTQDKKWEERYRETEPILDELIKDAINRGDKNDKELFENINVSNIALVKMEYDSLELVNKGQSEVAIQILESPEYWEQKKIYQKGFEDYAVKQDLLFNDVRELSDNPIDDALDKLIEMINFNRQILLFSIPIVIPSFIMLGFFISRSFSKPIKNIILGIDHIKEGDLEFVIKTEGSEEYREVIDTFNQMTTRIKESQSSIKQQLQQIENLQNSIDNSSIVAITDKDSTITYANKKFCDISKYSKEEIIGQNHRILKSGFHDDTFYQNIWKTISSGNIWHGDIKNKAKDGTFYWIRTTITPFLGKDGKPEQYIAVRTDITELYAQKDMIQLQFQELKKIDIQKDEFVTMVSHELKTPLVPIMGYAELLKTPEMSMTAEQLECVNEIYTNAERLESLISDMFDTQKLSLGEMKFNKKMLNLREFFTKITRNYASLLSEKQIRLDVSSTDITIDTDENRLHQVFDNLIRNAVDFVPNGGIISIGAKPQKDDVMFFVKDNGIGIPKEKQKDLFKKFYQVDTSYTRAHGGTGLGLVICKGIVENMGGKIWVESEEGKGTTFYFTIPK